MAFTEEKAGAGGMTEVVSSSLATWEDIDIVPGTEVMTDTIHGHEQIHGDGKTQVTLVPQPSADIHDPLVNSLTQHKYLPLQDTVLTNDSHHRIGLVHGKSQPSQCP